MHLSQLVQKANCVLCVLAIMIHVHQPAFSGLSRKKTEGTSTYGITLTSNNWNLAAASGLILF